MNRWLGFSASSSLHPEVMVRPDLDVVEAAIKALRAEAAAAGDAILVAYCTVALRDQPRTFADIDAYKAVPYRWQLNQADAWAVCEMMAAQRSL